MGILMPALPISAGCFKTLMGLKVGVLQKANTFIQVGEASPETRATF